MARTSKSLADQLFPEEPSKEEYAIIDIPPEKRRLHTETYDFSIATIHNYLTNGSIFIPSFQRGYVWSRAQASRLIESLIIQCPIPVIYLNQERDEKLSVIDGNQRLTSIKLFLEDEFELKGLTAYPELEGSFFSDLDPRFKRHITNRTLRCITILKETHPQIKFDVFERINTGAVQLNNQEVRHGVYHGSLMQLLDELSNESVWKEISGLKNDSRMKGSELILRFLALYHNISLYKKPLTGFLNKFCEQYSDIDEQTKLSWKALFLSTIEKVSNIFGKSAFRIIDENLKPFGNINAALFDAQMIAFSRISNKTMDSKRINITSIHNNFYELLSDPLFKESIESGTSATSLVNYRITAFENFLEKNLR